MGQNWGRMGEIKGKRGKMGQNWGKVGEIKGKWGKMGQNWGKKGQNWGGRGAATAEPYREKALGQWAQA